LHRHGTSVRKGSRRGSRHLRLGRRQLTGRPLRRAIHLVLFAAIACAQDTVRDTTGDGTSSISDSAGRSRSAGYHFDPLSIRGGTAFGALRLDSIEVRRAADASAVGIARFSGKVELRGWRMRHPDPEQDAECFEADETSAHRLPRWQGDERRPWFCYENREEARRLLARADALDTLVVSIDGFTIHRGMSDEVNGARLLAVLQVGGGAALIDGSVRPATAADPRWAIMRRASADLDGDGRTEDAILISNVGIRDGRPLWEDGHHWQLYIEAQSGIRTYLYSRFVPHGYVEPWLTEPDSRGRRRVVVLERSPFAVRSYEVQYEGAARVTARELFDFATDPSHGFSGIPY
jgi:hypothetical protein